MNMYFPKVVQVVPQKNYSVYVYFDDGKIVLYDVSSKIGKGVFSVLQDIDIFMNCCTVINDTLAWDINHNRSTSDCIDIDAFTLHELPSVKENIA